MLFELPPPLEGLVPEVADILPPGRGSSSRSLARELLRFLRLKALMENTSSQYVMSPPDLIDAAWHALLLESELLGRVHAALGVQVHHSTRQAPGPDAHASRLRATFSAALNVAENERSTAEPAAGGSSTPPLDMRIWEAVDATCHLARVKILPLDATGHAPRTLHAYVPHTATVDDLTDQLQRLYCVAPLLFRHAKDAVPLHLALRLSDEAPAAGSSTSASSSTGSAAAGRCLTLFATVRHVARHTAAAQGPPPAVLGAPPPLSRVKQEPQSPRAGPEAPAPKKACVRPPTPAAPHPSPPADIDASLNIIFQDQSGAEVHFKVKPHMALELAVSAWGLMTGIDVHTVRFVYDGWRVDASRTVGSLGMEEGDVVLVVQPQAGC